MAGCGRSENLAARATDGPDKPSDITAYDISDDGELANRQTLFDLKKVPRLEQMALNRPRNRRWGPAVQRRALAAPRAAAR